MEQIPFGDSPENNTSYEVELREGQCKAMIQHNNALFDDALVLEGHSQESARLMGVKFRDYYIRTTAISTPAEKAYAILLTPTGDWLRPDYPTEHFYVYFPEHENNTTRTVRATKDNIQWIEHVDESGVSTAYSLTDTALMYSELEFTPESVDQKPMSYPETKEIAKKIETFRLAVQVRTAR